MAELQRTLAGPVEKGRIGIARRGRWVALHQRHGHAAASQGQGGGHAGDAATDDEDALVHPARKPPRCAESET